MALIKEFETPQGVTAYYHKIIKIEISAIEEVTTIVTAIYATAKARDAGAQPLWHEYIRVPFTDMAMDPRVPFYELAASYVASYLSGSESDVDPNAITP